LLIQKGSLSLSIDIVNVAATSDELVNRVFANGIEFKAANETTLAGNVMSLERLIISDANE